MGQAILVRDKMPAQLNILYEGQARLLGYDPRTQRPVTLELMQPGAILGWVGLVRGVPCETAIASVETIALVIPAAAFLALLDRDPQFAAVFQNQCAPIEAFDLLGAEIHRRAIGDVDLKDLVLQAQKEAVVCSLPPGTTPIHQLERDRVWLVSGGGTIEQFPVASRLSLQNSSGVIEVVGTEAARLIGIPKALMRSTSSASVAASVGQAEVTVVDSAPDLDIRDADDRPPELDPGLRPRAGKQPSSSQKFPFIRGRGPVDSAVACFQMLCQHLSIPFRRDVIQRVLSSQSERTGSLSLELCGAVSELMGLNAQLVMVPASAIGRLEAPAMVKWQDTTVLLYEISERELVIAVPDLGIVRRKPADFVETWGEQGEVLLLRPTRQTPQQRFNLKWFLPSIKKHRRVLIEVFVASFFVQLFALANPLMVQVIIDKVIVQNSVDTLQVLGIFLVVLAVFEAILTSLRTYLSIRPTASTCRWVQKSLTTCCAYRCAILNGGPLGN
jgi:ATP-binding cassette subfamily B protein